MILLSARKLTSRFNMMTINEVSLNRSTLLPIFCVIFLFFKSKLFPIAVRFSAEILSPYGGFPSQSGSFGFRSFFLIILLNHLPYETQKLNLFGLSGLLSHSVFWDIFNSSISAIRVSSSQILPANKARPRRIHQIFVHFEMSRLRGGLGPLANSNSIP